MDGINTTGGVGDPIAFKELKEQSNNEGTPPPSPGTNSMRNSMTVPPTPQENRVMNWFSPPPRAADDEPETAVTDLSLLLARPPRGLAMEIEDKSMIEAFRRNPESLSKDGISLLLKKKFMTTLIHKLQIVPLRCLPNAVRALSRLLVLAGAHNKKMWEEYRLSSATEDLSIRLVAAVQEGRYGLATDLMDAYQTLLYVGEGIETTEDASIDYLGGEHNEMDMSPASAPEASRVKNRQVYAGLTNALSKIGSQYTCGLSGSSPEVEAPYVKFTGEFMEVVMRAISSSGNMKALMVGHPLIPILQKVSEFPPEVQYKACTWISFICTWNRCAPLQELAAIVESIQQAVSMDTTGMDPVVASFRFYSIVRSMRYLVVSTIQSDAKFRVVWFQTGLIGCLVRMLSDRSSPVYYHPLTVSLTVDTLLWLIKSNAKNAQMTLASGGSKAVQVLLQKDSHFAEGVALWLHLMKELAQEAMHPDTPDEQFSLNFKEVVSVLLTDLELKFLAGAFDDSSAAEVYSSAVETSYIKGLQDMAGISYTAATWSAPGVKAAVGGLSKTLHQCILLLHSLVTTLIPDLDEMNAARGPSPIPSSAELAHDGITFIMPSILSSIRRHRNDAMNWLIIRPSVSSTGLTLFKKILGIRKAFLRVGGLDRVLGVVDFCVNKLEADEWPFCSLCINERIHFSSFMMDNHTYGTKAEEATTMAEFFGSALLAFACTVSRGYIVNQVETLVDGGRDGPNRSLAERKAMAGYEGLSLVLYRLLRRTFPEVASEDLAASRKAYEILAFPLRFLLSIAIGGYSPLVEQVLNYRHTNNSPVAELNTRDTDLHGPRALLLALELLFEYPLSQGEPYAGALQKLNGVLEFTKKLLRSERNLEVALDAGIVRSLVWGSGRPAAGHAVAETAILNLLSSTAKQRVTPEELRTWLNIILYDYTINPSLQRNREAELANIEQRRLNLLRVLVDVANGCSDKPSDYLSRTFGNVYGSAPLVAFDPSGDERSPVGPRLYIDSLHPDGSDDVSSADSASRAKPWPPTRGYTFSCWIYIQSFDKIRRLPLLSLVEESETITSIDIVEGTLSICTGNNKESVVSLDRLPKLTEGQWWHITVVHQKPRMKISTGVSTVTVSLQGGRWSQTCKLSYPRSTAGLHRIKCLIGQSRSSTHAAKVKWYLGPTYLFSEPLSETQTSIHYAVGPSFNSLFLGEDGVGSVPLVQDICNPSQLRAILLNNKADYRSGGGDHHHYRTSHAATLRAPVAGARRDVAGVPRAQFTDLSAVPVENIGIQPDMVVFCLAPRRAGEYSANLEAMIAYATGALSPLRVQLSGGAISVTRCRLADNLKWVCQVPLVPVIMLVERAATVDELQLSLEFLLALTHAHPANLLQMENSHLYAVLAQLLRRKSRKGLIVSDTVNPLLAMVGRVNLDTFEWKGASLLAVNIQAFQHIILSFDIWKTADPSVHRLILKTLQDSIAMTNFSADENDGLLVAQEMNLKRLQFSSITRAFLAMLSEPDIQYDLMLNMCDLLYMVLTRATPPIEDLHAVVHFLYLTLSARFLRLYSDDKFFRVFKPAGSETAKSSLPSTEDITGLAAARQARIKIIRRSLLRLLLTISECYIRDSKGTDKDSSRVGLLKRALPLKYLIYTIYHFGDTLTWTGTGGSKSDPSVRVGRNFRRHQDPVSALYAFTLLVGLVPFEIKDFEKAAGFRELQISLPAVFKALCLQVETDMPTLSQGNDMWGELYIWSPKHLSRENKDVSTFFGAPVEEGIVSICSPTYQHSLRMLYINMFSLLFGSVSNFNTLENFFDSANPRRADIPSQVIVFPAILPAIFNVLATAASMSTPEGLTRMVSSRTFARGDEVDLQKEFVAARSEAAKLVGQKALRLLNNLYVESQEVKELWRGEHDGGMGPVPQGGLGGSKWIRPPKSEELMEELVQVWYSGLMATLVQNFKPKGGAGATAKTTRRSVWSSTENGAATKPRSPRSRLPSESPSPTAASDPSASAEVTEKPGDSLVCRLAMRLIVSVAMDRVLHQSRGIQVLHTVLDISPRDTFLFNPVAGFNATLQAHFRSTMLLHMVEELRSKLFEGGPNAAQALLSASNYKLVSNLPRFFGLLISNTFLAKNWQESPYLPPVSGAGTNQYDFWLLKTISLAVDMLKLVVVRPDSGEGSLGAVIRTKQGKGSSALLGNSFFGLSKWMGDEVEEWIPGTLDVLRKLIIAGLNDLEADLAEETALKLFEVMIRHLNLLFPTMQTQKGAESDRVFMSGLMFYLYPLLYDEKKVYREAAMYIWRELLLSNPQRKILDQLFSVSIQKPGASKKDKDSFVSYDLLAGHSEVEGFDLLIKVDTGSFTFMENLPKPTPAPKGRVGTPLGAVSADKEFQSWLGSLEEKIRRAIENNLYQTSKDLRSWPETTATSSIQHYQTGVTSLEKKRVKALYDLLKHVYKHTGTWRRELLTRQDQELRRQVRWRQERLDRETFGSRYMDMVFDEVMEGCSLCTVLRSSVGLEKVIIPSKKGGTFTPSTEDADRLLAVEQAQELVHGTTLDISDGGLMEHMVEGSGFGDVMLDSAEGPMRMRKRLIRSNVKLSHVAHQILPPSESAPPVVPAKTESATPSVTTAPSPRGYGNNATESQDMAWMRDAGNETGDEFDFFESFDDDDEQDGQDDEEEEEEEEGEGEEESYQEDEEGGAAPPLSDMSDAARRSMALKAKLSEQRRAAWQQQQQQQQQQEHPQAEEGKSADADEEDDSGEDLVGADDKLKPFLVPGDDINDRFNCAKVKGVYSHPSILLLCGGNLYIIENYKLEQVKDAADSKSTHMEVVEIEDTGDSSHGESGGQPSADQASAGGDIAWLSTTSLKNEPVKLCGGLRSKCTPENTGGPSHHCNYWAYEDVKVVYRRRYLLRHTAIEIFLSNGENYLIIFDSPEIRQDVYNKLLSRCESATSDGGRSPFDEIQNFLNIANPNNVTERWVRGEITNFQYLMHLNTLAGRSYNDLTQYPVFPWVIADWESGELDLNNPIVYRDLTKPMGAINPARENEFRERYELLKESYDNAGGAPEVRPPFHYGTHYSSAAIVLYYLIRLQPFAEQHVRLQSGRFDRPDRLFSTMHKSWLASSGGHSTNAEVMASMSGGNTQDVRELIPEFFYLPDFLVNANEYDFGHELTGHEIDDVVLPPWAKGSAHEFIRLHRQALESDYVSRNLHHWIDLIFGYKQRGRAAEEACNVYYYLTYEGAIDLESVEDPTLRKAYVDQIHEFGQTPTQLFRQPHPARVFPVAETAKEGGSTAWLKKLPISLARAPGLSSATPNISDSIELTEDLTDGDASSNSPTNNYHNRGSSYNPMAANGPTPTSAVLPVKGWKQTYKTWYLQEVKRVQSSEVTLRNLPTRKATSFLSPLVIDRANTVAKLMNLADSTAPVDQRAIGQIQLANEKVLALSSGCVGLPNGTSDFLAWGFADDCLRVCPVAAIDGSGMAERRVLATYSLDSANPISVLALSSDGKTMITGSATQPVLHLWSLHEIRRKGSRRQQPITSLGSLISSLHQGSIVAVGMSSKYGIVVSLCSHNRVALLWDLNKMRLARQLALPGISNMKVDRPSAYSISIDECTGTIVVCVGLVIHVFDVNGSPRAIRDLSLCEDIRNPNSVTSCAVVGDGCAPTAVVTGHMDGMIRVWILQLDAKPQPQPLAPVACREEKDKEETEDEQPSLPNVLTCMAELYYPYPRDIRPPITAVVMSPDQKRFYTGDAQGTVLSWSSYQIPTK